MSCHGGSWMPGILQLPYQEPACGKSVLLQLDQGLDSLPLDTRTRETLSINRGQS